MSQASASEKPAPAAGPLTAAITGIGDPPQVDDRLVQRLGATPHFGREVDLLRLDPLLEGVDVPSGAERLAGAGHDQRPQGARSASQAKATVSSRIISGLIALNASGRSRVRVPISPSISRSAGSSARAGSKSGWSSALSPYRRSGLAVRPGAYSLVRDRRGTRTSPARSESRSSAAALPDSPGVYLFYDGDGELLYVGKARSIRKRVASHFSGGESRLTSRVERIEFLVTANEAEALLAEQSFIKRHRPRFNIRLRDDKSYPYVAVSLDEDYPRVYFTREKHRTGPRLLRPLLERQAGARDARPARQAVPVPHLRGGGAGPPLRQPLPRLLHQALRGALRRLHRAARSTGATSRRSSTSSPAATARWKRTSRRTMEAAAQAREFERAAMHRDRLKAIRLAVRAPAHRRRLGWHR